MSIQEQIAAAMGVLADPANPAGASETATHTTENGVTVTPDLRCTVARRTAKDEVELLEFDTAMQTAEASALASDWPTVRAGDTIGLGDGNWSVVGDPVTVHGLLIMDLARSRPR
jgi:hypothetical protein